MSLGRLLGLPLVRFELKMFFSVIKVQKNQKMRLSLKNRLITILKKQQLEQNETCHCRVYLNISNSN